MILVDYNYAGAPPGYAVQIMHDLTQRGENSVLYSEASEAKAFSNRASRVVVYADYGVGENLTWHRGFHKHIEYRYLYPKDLPNDNPQRPGECPPDDRP